MIQRSSLPEQVFRELAGAVLSGRYAAGERLPGQRALAAELGVNMASVREGIKRLEQLRLVDVRHGDAMRATDWRAQGGLDVLVYAAAADSAELGALFEARRLLLREAARLAAQRRTEEQASALREIAAAIVEGDVQQRDLAFFTTLIEGAHNLVFTLILNSFKTLYLEQLHTFTDMVDSADAPLYAEAARAIADHQPDAAAAAVEQLAARHEERMC